MVAILGRALMCDSFKKGYNIDRQLLISLPAAAEALARCKIPARRLAEVHQQSLQSAGGLAAVFLQLPTGRVLTSSGLRGSFKPSCQRGPCDGIVISINLVLSLAAQIAVAVLQDGNGE